jgi:hypothetical protein
VPRAPIVEPASGGAAQPRAMSRERRECEPQEPSGSYSRRSRRIVIGRFAAGAGRLGSESASIRVIRG